MIVDVIVEVPRAARNRYGIDQATGRVRLNRTALTAARFPGDYGFVERTLRADGDRLAALVLLDKPTFPGCVIPARPVAMAETAAGAVLIAVPATDPRWDHVCELDDLNPWLQTEISNAGQWRDRVAVEAELSTALRRARARHMPGGALVAGNGVGVAAVPGLRLTQEWWPT